MRRHLALVLLVLSGLTACTTTQTAARAPELVPGSFVPGTQPDGNSVLLDAPAGLIVIDTGRHRSHTQSVLDAGAKRNNPIVAVINSHWHLDHIGGNALVREAFPAVRIYASGALNEALGGFLASYGSQLKEMIAKSESEAERKTYSDELALIDAGPRLAPDEVIAASGEREIAGRRLVINLEKNAVTGGDLWIVDPVSGTVVAGDLVTLPFPFLDTACPDRWRSALARVAETRFTTLIPGHGPSMSRQEFETYRTAFGHLLDCGASDASVESCADGWLRDAGDLVPAGDQKFTRSLAGYYVPNSLRAPPEKLAKLCGG